MAKVIVQSDHNPTNQVEIWTQYDSDGDVSYTLHCAKGAWCDRPEDRPAFNMDDAVAWAENHVNQHD